jgi:hypothetical protein
MHGHHHRRREFVRETENGERSNDARAGSRCRPRPWSACSVKERTEAASYAEGSGSALRLFEALVDEHEKGSEFALKRASGETLAYKIFV